MTSSRPFFRVSFLGLAAVAASASVMLAVAPARAADPSDPDTAPSVAVRTTGIDLSTEAGAQMLYQRIVGAAHNVCPQADSRDLVAYGAERACERAAIERAVEAAHSEKLVQVAASHPPRIG